MSALNQLSHDRLAGMCRKLNLVDTGTPAMLAARLQHHRQGHPQRCPDCGNPWRNPYDHHECGDWRHWDEHKAHVDTSNHLPCVLCGGLTYSRGTGGHAVHRRCCFDGVERLDPDREPIDHPAAAASTASHQQYTPPHDPRPCCAGGTLVLSCQLCEDSPSYYRKEHSA